jgi:GMP reductase
MCGSIMAGYDENGGKTVLIDGERKYIYYGSASWSNKGHNSHIEGTEIIIDYKGSMNEFLYDLECSLKSSVSYAGKTRLMDIKGTPMISIR